jgi:hypothetical protein
MPLPEAGSRPQQAASPWHWLASSRQRRYQARHKALGLCILCPRPALSEWHCLMHLRKLRVSKRRKRHNHPWEPGRAGRPPLETRYGQGQA